MDWKPIGFIFLVFEAEWVFIFPPMQALIFHVVFALHDPLSTPAPTALARPIRTKSRRESAAPTSLSRGDSSLAAHSAWARDLRS